MRRTKSAKTASGALRGFRNVGEALERVGNLRNRVVGQQGDDLKSLIESAKRRGIKVESGVQTLFDPDTGAIVLAPDAKIWEFFEEFLHKKVNNGWKIKEIQDLTKELRKVKDARGYKSVKAPARSAEEIFVKNWLLRHGHIVGVGDAERVLLQHQIDRLGRYGTGRGY